ncbi:hypothetical protein HHK36_021273 [Tetracentron sinense]|uniref:Leucine-rich repeat-containing N-terminal plant-type domain-containing protein n=1 Tax=Tetracentron sinense TaxID=13715 RepID=A0A835D9R8_TETSI|nr:hypothetical protein HHK36_021273 [Tetracentron sinense]
MERSMRVVVFLLFGFLTLATISFYLCNGDLNIVCSERERRALLRFKQDLKDPSNRLFSWDGEGDCCTWTGVHCDNLTGHVIKLQLQNPYDIFHLSDDEFGAYERSTLGGEIDPSLLELKHLNYLDLSQNDFGGIHIPKFFGSIGSLRYLNLSEAGFEGMIPHQLGNLSNLHYLSLGGSYPYSEAKLLTVENLQWLSSLSSLQHLEMSLVNLSKVTDWLQVTNMLPSLLELHLSYCELEVIPPLSYVNFTSLSILDLSFNHFNSFIPTWFFSLSHLVSLKLRSCGFYGPIPNALRNMTSLRVFDVSRNGLNSSIPDSLFSLNGLVSLNLRDNLGFQGPIPRALQNLTGLRVLELDGINFNSTLPDWLYNFSSLERLSLEDNNFQGTISSAIGKMISLTYLDLSNNDLEGGLPRSIGKMISLTYLLLSNNDLQGGLPRSIGKMISLTYLDLLNNDLEGGLPRSIGNLCNLKELSLSGNKFSGKLSGFLESLFGCIESSLISLQLGRNQLSGQFLDQLIHLKNLASLGLEGNSISGPIPVSIGRLSSLRSLYIYDNQLNGTIPESLGQLSKLEGLYISNNSFEGVVSEAHFANLKRLYSLYASSNSLVMKVGSDWIPPFQLKYISLSSWQIGPQFPAWLRTQKDCEILDLSGTRISDTIPNWFWNLSSQIGYLNLSHNQIYGEIPSSVKFGGNYLSGLDLSNNFFSGSISLFLCHKTDKPNSLKFLDLTGNLLSGDIPDCWMNWQALKVVKLGNNNLTGDLPSSIGSLSSLQSLHLRNNSLFGELPTSLQNCKELSTIDLSGNKFSGNIPTWIGKSLSSLIVLVFRANKFKGDIPRELCHLYYLQILDLAHNQLSGTIPRCFNNFSAMATKQNSSRAIFYSFPFGGLIETAVLMTKGREFEYGNTLTLVTSMDLSSNSLSGEIPEELTSLLGLLSLNLSENHLTGKIPEKIGDMGSLESLDFSGNQLTGVIPGSMSSLSFLSHLNLAYNNLTGRIPTSTQLQSFDASNFIGNKLCGLPLTENCTGGQDSIPNHGGVGLHKDDDGFEMSFFVSMALGFVVGFWGIFGPLLYSKSWRDAYFGFLDRMKDKLCGDEPMANKSVGTCVMSMKGDGIHKSRKRDLFPEILRDKAVARLNELGKIVILSYEDPGQKNLIVTYVDLCKFIFIGAFALVILVVILALALVILMVGFNACLDFSSSAEKPFSAADAGGLRKPEFSLSLLFQLTGCNVAVEGKAWGGCEDDINNSESWEVKRMVLEIGEHKMGFA